MHTLTHVYIQGVQNSTEKFKGVILAIKRMKHYHGTSQVTGVTSQLYSHKYRVLRPKLSWVAGNNFQQTEE